MLPDATVVIGTRPGLNDTSVPLRRYTIVENRENGHVTLDLIQDEEDHTVNSPSESIIRGELVLCDGQIHFTGPTSYITLRRPDPSHPGVPMPWKLQSILDDNVQQISIADSPLLDRLNQSHGLTLDLRKDPMDEVQVNSSAPRAHSEDQLDLPTKDRPTADEMSAIRNHITDQVTPTPNGERNTVKDTPATSSRFYAISSATGKEAEQVNGDAKALATSELSTDDEGEAASTPKANVKEDTQEIPGYDPNDSAAAFPPSSPPPQTEIPENTTITTDQEVPSIFNTASTHISVESVPVKEIGPRATDDVEPPIAESDKAANKDEEPQEEEIQTAEEPAPKKRGRPKKSTELKPKPTNAEVVEDEVEDNYAINEEKSENPSQASTRKRKTIDPDLSTRSETPSKRLRSTQASPSSSTTTTQQPPLRVLFSNSTLPQLTKTLTQARTLNIKPVEKAGPKTFDVLAIGKGEIKKTSKLLLAVALGKPVVFDEWVSKSVKAGKQLDIASFTARDPKREKEWGYDPTTTSSQDRSALLRGKTIHVTPALKASWGKTGFEDISMLSKAVGAEFVVAKSAKGKAADKNTIFLGSEGRKDADCRDLLSHDVECFTRDLIPFSVLRGSLQTESEEFRILEDDDGVDDDSGGGGGRAVKGKGKAKARMTGKAGAEATGKKGAEGNDGVKGRKGRNGKG